MAGRGKMSHVDQKEDIHQHSGWLIPAIFLFAILLLSGLFLGWYLRPGPKMTAAPTGQSTLVDLTVRGQAFNIPANYILFLFLCEQPAPELPSPNCLATDQPLGKTASLSWRFKRAYLARWRELSDGVGGLMARFQTRHAG